MRASRSVAVLFSDIVGSTPLLAAGQDRYPDLLLRHRELLGMAAVRHGGTLAPREGDGCLGLFPSTTAAISAGVDGQHALAAEPWPEGLTVRVRMVVHEGDVVDADGEPVGLAVHYAARMLVRAGAAQVLVSETAAASASTLPQGIRLVDGGTHRLRDLPRPIRLLQVAADGLVVLDPALTASSLSAPRSYSSRRALSDDSARPAGSASRHRRLARSLPWFRGRAI